MLEVKSEKMVKCFFPKSFLDDLGGVPPRLTGVQGCLHQKAPSPQSSIGLGPNPSLIHFHALDSSPELRPAREEVHLHFSYPFR
jgi:hypothetical protein